MSLIDGDTMVEILAFDYMNDTVVEKRMTVLEILKELADYDAPTIDAVEVVRCKECKHRPIKEDAEGEDYGFNITAPNGDELCPCLVEDGWYSWMPKDNFHCGYGERKESK